LNRICALLACSLLAGVILALMFSRAAHGRKATRTPALKETLIDSCVVPWDSALEPGAMCYVLLPTSLITSGLGDLPDPRLDVN
jgi:hypothetical protein